MHCQMPIDPVTRIALEGDALEAALKNPYASRCGYKLQKDDMFCPACGAKIKTGMVSVREAFCDDDANVALAIAVALADSSMSLPQCPPAKAPPRPSCKDDKKKETSGGDMLKDNGLLFSKHGGRPSIGLDWAVLWLGVCVGGIIGIMVWSTFISRSFWLFVLLASLFAVMECAAEAMVCIYKVAFLDNGEQMPEERAKVIRWMSIAFLCVPLLSPAYGFVQGGIESIRYVDTKQINLAQYFINKSQMNLFTRIGYRWIYHMIWDFGETVDNILETSQCGADGFFQLNGISSSPTTASPNSGDEELLMRLDDSTLSMKISTAMLKNDFAEARRLVKQISDKDLRDFQNALIDNAESLDANQKKLQKGLKEFQDNLKAAEIRGALFGGR